MHCGGGGKNGKNRERSHQIFIPNKVDFAVRALRQGAKCHQNRIKIAVVGVFTDRLTE